MSRQKAAPLLILLLLSVVLASMLLACARPSTPPSYTLMPTAGQSPAPTLNATTTVPTTPSPSPLASPKPAAIVHLNLGDEPDSLDPARVDNQAGLNVVENLFLGLTHIDPQTGEVLPELARSWEPSENATVWTFRLREDVYWTRYEPENGAMEPLRHVTAADVVYALQRCLTMAEASEWTEQLYIIRNAAALHNSQASSPTIGLEDLGLAALDTYTVRFELERPAAYFPSILSLGVARPLPQEAIEEYGEQWGEPGYLWSNAAYTLQSWDHNVRLLLRKNPFHYRAENVQIELVDFVMLSDTGSSLEAYEKGDLDSVLLPGAGRELACWPQCEILNPILFEQLVIVALPCTYYYGFNTAHPPFDDVHVRRAFSQAIDRQTVIREILQDVHRPAHSFAAPGTWGTAVNNPEVGLFYDPQQAAAELALSDYADGDLPTITLVYNRSDWHQRVAEAIRQMWSQTLDVQIQLQSLPWESYMEALSTEIAAEEAPQVWRLGYCAHYPDQHNWLYDVFDPDEGTNRPRLSVEDPQVGAYVQEFGDLLQEAAQETTPLRQRELYQRAEHLLVYEIAAIAPIFYYNQIYASKPYLQRDYPVFGGIQIETWRLEP
ncbi:MAG: peptide ABC transporter substrate-binding protein [Chloroflexia bacterium]|nr:peptide ABC transporter substrate-binding protein [Chloroflexia bacterium]